MKKITFLIISTLCSLSLRAENFVFIDIDNTLIKNEKPIIELVQKAKEIQNNSDFKVFYLSGRTDNQKNRLFLENWFNKYDLDSSLIRLKDENFKKSSDFKYDFVKNLIDKNNSDNVLIIDDSQKNLSIFKNTNFETILVKNYQKNVMDINNILKRWNNEKISK